MVNGPICLLGMENEIKEGWNWNPD